MRIFTIAGRAPLAMFGVGLLAFGVAFLWGAASAGLWPLGIALAALPWGAGWRYVLRDVYQLRVADDGTVSLVRLVGTRHFSARQIYVLEGKLRRDSYNATDVWSLSVGHAAGRTEVAAFDRATEFAAAVRAHNPRVEITGLWPMGAP